MPLKGRIIVAIIAFFLFFVVLNLIRKRRMKIEYSILWLGVSLAHYDVTYQTNGFWWIVLPTIILVNLKDLFVKDLTK